MVIEEGLWGPSRFLKRRELHVPGSPKIYKAPQEIHDLTTIEQALGSSCKEPLLPLIPEGKDVLRKGTEANGTRQHPAGLFCTHLNG